MALLDTQALINTGIGANEKNDALAALRLEFLDGLSQLPKINGSKVKVRTNRDELGTAFNGTFAVETNIPGFERINEGTDRNVYAHSPHPVHINKFLIENGVAFHDTPRAPISIANAPGKPLEVDLQTALYAKVLTTVARAARAADLVPSQTSQPLRLAGLLEETLGVIAPSDTAGGKPNAVGGQRPARKLFGFR